VKYRIVYRDGRIGEPHAWEMLLFYVRLSKKLPHGLKATGVVSA
jgi:hypothetical protein